MRRVGEARGWYGIFKLAERMATFSFSTAGETPEVHRRGRIQERSASGAREVFGWASSRRLQQQLEQCLHGSRGAAVEEVIRDAQGGFSLCWFDEGAVQLYRDHAGQQPLYWAYGAVEGQRVVIFGSDFHAICEHMGDDAVFDHGALLDLLTYGYISEMQRTGVQGVWRVPPGYTLRVDGEGETLRPYWSFTSRPASADFSTEVLLEKLRSALAESVPDDIECISLSGGLDSSSVAALALEEGLLHADCTAVTFARGSTDEEFLVAEQTAGLLGLEHQLVELGSEDVVDVQRFLQESARASAFPVSFGRPHSATVERDASLVLTGFGGDPLQKLNLHHLREWRSCAGLLAAGRGYWRYWRDEQRVPPLFLGERIGRENHHRWQPWQVSFLKQDPPAFSAPDSSSSASPRASLFGSPIWTALLESRHWSVAEGAGCYADPFLDWKLAEYMEAIPAIPWLVRKKALRTAMRARLPDAVLSRRKTVHQRARVERTMSDAWKYPAVYEEIRRLIEEVGDDPYLDLPAVADALDVPNPPRWWSFRLRRIGSYLKWKRDLMELGVGPCEGRSASL
jgi:hypothetical protein